MGSPAGFTRRAFALRAGTTLLILLAIWPSLALAQSGTTGAGGPTAEGLLDTTARLCTQGRFEQASAAARQLLLLRQGNRDAKPHEITDAQWLVKTCDLAAGLSGENQAQLASAYAMDAQLDDQYERGRFSEGATQAARQLEIRERLLGREHPETARSLSRRGREASGLWQKVYTEGLGNNSGRRLPGFRRICVQRL